MSCNVLIVEDSAILRTAIKKIVKIAGVGDDHIFEAGHGRDALAVLDTVWIDLVLLDLNMPIMDGEEFATELRKRPDLNDVTVVVVSTESNKDRLERMRRLGVVEALHKPFEPEALRRLITRELGVTI